MKRTLTAVFLGSILLLTSSFQKKSEDDQAIYWYAQRKLTWDDFKGKPIPTNMNDVINVSVYQYTADPAKTNPNILAFTITTYFSKVNSWAKPESRTPERVVHEQGKFDLVEIHSRLFRKTLMETPLHKNAYNRELHKIWNESLHFKNSELGSYDRDTENGKNKAKQDKWDKDIQKRLKELEKYYNMPVKVNLAD